MGHLKETTHVLFTASVKTDRIFFFFPVCPFTGLLWGGFPRLGRRVCKWLGFPVECVLESDIELSVLDGSIFSSSSVQEFVLFHYEFCCWNCLLVLRTHRRSCVNSKKGVESTKLNWRLSCSKQSPGTETFCQKTIACEWSWSQLR